MLVISAARNERQKFSEHWPSARFDARVGPVNVPSSKCRKGTSECSECVHVLKMDLLATAPEMVPLLGHHLYTPESAKSSQAPL